MFELFSGKGLAVAVAAFFVLAVVIICQVHTDKPNEPEIITPSRTTTTVHATTTFIVLPEYPIDLNAATYDELVLIEGISPQIAGNIIEYRNNNGDFVSVEQLIEVYGIGPVTLDKIMPYFYAKTPQHTSVTTTEITTSTTLQSAANTPAKTTTQAITVTTAVTDAITTTSSTTTTATPSQTQAATTTIFIFTQRIELNAGTLEDFLTIPILTAEQAQAIIDLRERIDYFSHYYELLYAEGFNEQLVSKMNDYVYVEGQSE